MFRTRFVICHNCSASDPFQVVPFRLSQNIDAAFAQSVAQKQRSSHQRCSRTVSHSTRVHSQRQAHTTLQHGSAPKVLASRFKLVVGKGQKSTAVDPRTGGHPLALLDLQVLAPQLHSSAALQHVFLEQPEKMRRGGDILPPTPEQWYQQDDEHMRGAVLVVFSRGQPFNEASSWFVTKTNFEIKCKTKSDITRVEFKSNAVQLFPRKAYRHKTDNPLAQFGRRGKISCVRQGRSPTEQIDNLLATLWNAAHDFVNQRFTNMDDASPASSADRPIAGTNLVDEASGISVPLS